MKICLLHDSNLRNVELSETAGSGTSIHVRGTANCVYTVELKKFPGNMSQQRVHERNNDEVNQRRFQMNYESLIIISLIIISPISQISKS